ncbi:hypothetical protein NBZ79_10890 [Sneathiella marina]|uniref:Uncharacterized protein n=1 Tax=Sneathiella marina TaxID=2950108 RepID=A0ABY4VXY9_9PROT|nr:hypothetical protein [Sneathiella marina]USG59688.1 hypothetical protein NBZ79_10890 [Sneathiella marina]
MDPRFGRPVIRDRWGEPIEPEPPDPKHSKPKSRIRRLYCWCRGKLTVFARDRE